MIAASQGVARFGAPLVVVGSASEDRVAAVNLFEKNNARELVRQRHRAKREQLISPLKLGPVGTTNDEAEVESTRAALLKEAAEGDAVVLLAGVVKQHQVGFLGHALWQLL
jgi:hypothetical protein